MPSPAVNTGKPPIVLPASGFPHIVDAILGHSDLPTLLAFRRASPSLSALTSRHLAGAVLRAPAPPPLLHALLGHADHASLIRLRGVCRALRALADQHLARWHAHLILRPLDGARHLVVSARDGSVLGTTRGARDPRSACPLARARVVELHGRGLIVQEALDVLGRNRAAEIWFGPRPARRPPALSEGGLRAAMKALGL